MEEVIDVPDHIIFSLREDFIARFQMRVHPFRFVRGGQDEAEILMDEGPLDYSPKAQAEYIEKLEDVRVEDSGSVCSICLDEMAKGSEVKRLPCCHMYHCNCIGEWLKNKNTCPVCRHQVAES